MVGSSRSVHAKATWTIAEVRPLLSTMLRLAGPSLVENLLQTALGIASMLMVSRLGASAIAAVGISNQFVNLIIMSFSGLAVGNTSLVARNVGAGDVAGAAQVARQSLILAAFVGIVIGIVAFFGSGPALLLTGAEPEVIALGTDYLRILGSTAILMVLMLVGGGTLRGAGDTVTPMIATLLTNVVNVVAAMVLIFGLLGVPALGVTGAAWAAVIARLVGTSYILWKLVRGGRSLTLGGIGGWRPDLKVMRRIIQIGGPASIESFTVQIGLMVFNLIAVQIGTVAFATQQIIFNAAQLSMLPGMAFSVAATTLVGQSLGAKNPRRAELSGWLAVVSALGWMTAMGVAYVAFAEQWMRLYSGESEIVRLGVTIMVLLAIGQPLQACAFVLSGALRGAGDTRATMWGGMIGTCLFRVPIAGLLGLGLGMGLVGVWIGWLSDWLLRAAVYIWRFRSGRWQRLII